MQNRVKIVKDLKIRLKQLEVDFFILPNSDSFFLEFVPKRYRRVEFLTGFEGSNCQLLIKEGKSCFFTDGRYTLQAKQEIDLDEFEIVDLADESLIKRLSKELSKGKKVAIDPKLHSVEFVNHLQEICDKKKVELYMFQSNPVDQIWEDAIFRGTKFERPKNNNYKIVDHSQRYCGRETKDKIKDVLKKCKSDAVLICEAESICWLFNIRCHGAVDYSPILPCYAFLYKDGSCDFFLDFDGSTGGLTFFKDKKIFFRRIKFKTKPSKKFKSIEIDPKQTNYAIYKALLESDIKVKEATNSILEMKAVKNDVEVHNAIKAHKIDGVAVTKFLYWLDMAMKKGEVVDELKAERKLLEFRKKGKGFVYDSFRSISGFGSNGAIIHYHSSEKTNKKFEGNSLYLIDSGGQYRYGTTDITRTVAIGKPTKLMKRNFTLVLKGHIALSMAVFDGETSGADLDKIAREPLNKEKKDYAHGTGHGVGSFLSVHEGPVSISKNAKNHFFKPGMILSNEPGYYKEGAYGIRIENLVVIEKNSKDKFVFKPLTLVPIDSRLVDFEILDDLEKLWLKNYHNEILLRLGPKLSKDELAWMTDIADSFVI